MEGKSCSRRFASKIRIVLVLVTLAVLVLTIMSAGAAALDRFVGDGDDNKPPIDEPSLVTPQVDPHPDAPAVAKMLGVNEAEAAEILEFQRELDDLIYSGFAKSESFAGVVYEERRPAATLLVKGEADKEAKELAAHPGVELHDGLRWSQAELLELQGEVHRLVVEEEPNPGSIETATEFESQTIEVRIATDQPRSALTAADIVRKQRPVEVARDVPVEPLEAADIEIVMVPSADRLVLDHTYGGSLMTSSQGNCTGGFTVVNLATNEEGIMSAAHCESINTIKERNTSRGAINSYSAPFRKEHIGVWGDIEWHATTHWEYNIFLEKVNQTRTVTSVSGGQSVGQSMCKYGRSTGYGCSTVNKVLVSVTFDNPWGSGQVGADGMTRMNGHTTSGGDSGGPWFANNQAKGIHHGGNSSYSYFTPANRAETGLGVVIQTC